MSAPNDIEATGACCCNGCVGEGPCDSREPDDGDDDRCYWNCDGGEEHCDHHQVFGTCCECGAA